MNTSPGKDSETVRDFLDASDWKGAEIAPLAGDASSRSYFRVSKAERGAILMSAPPGAETSACPPGATPEERRALGYNAEARLAGPNLHAFTAIAETLRSAGLSAPEIYAADAGNGLALIEDLGDGLFAKVVGDIPEATLYKNAVDVLLHLHGETPAPPHTDAFRMLDYDGLALEAEADLLLDWYWPLKKGTAPGDDEASEYRDLFSGLLSRLSPPRVMVLRDYHAENLLWLPKRDGVKRVGLIDFQDGLVGSPAYDLVSLLEDARRDVDEGLAESMMTRYAEGMKAQAGFEIDQFRDECAILALQRNAKILGIFARLAERDGKRRYLDLLPRVEAHFRRDLSRPAVAPARAFFKRHFPDFVQ